MLKLLVVLLAAVGAVLSDSDTLYFEPSTPDDPSGQKDVTHTPLHIYADMQCPDKESTCPKGTTCCLMLNQHYGCCPMENAVCCADHLHCCQEGSTCDLEKGTCIQGNGMQVQWQGRFPAKIAASPLGDDVSCPDKSTCPDGTTCCQTGPTAFGCCPFPSAACCADNKHCCPQGYACDVTAGVCTLGENLVTVVTSKPYISTFGRGLLHVSEVGGQKSYGENEAPLAKYATPNFLCPDKLSSCLDGTTCCLMLGGKYGCCNLPDAVCCSDHLHCCPTGTKCNLPEMRCDGGSMSMSISMYAVQRHAAVSVPIGGDANGPCDDKAVCPSGNTCCPTIGGGYACCVYKDGVCCSDMIHCCASGYKCDVEHGRCVTSSSGSLTTEVTKNELQDVICPDGTSSCPTGSTCCLLTTGQYGCCPLPEAVCCSDKLHCCPQGTTCDIPESKCLREGASPVPWAEKTASFTASKPPALRDVICPDSSTCPTGNTCCQLVTGDYGCCPLPSAVCCTDHLHCCPSGTTCDVTGSRCISADGFRSVPWSTKVPAKKATDFERLVSGLSDTDALNDVVCPDQVHRCPDDSTCCKLATGIYGCCPLISAVCCSDGEHCCPSGTTCDVKHAQCLSGAELAPLSWSLALAARAGWKTQEEGDRKGDLGNIICPDRVHQCYDGNTCCKLTTGEWGCCPLPSAVCCSDGSHCCPSGYTCDVAAQTCKRQTDDVIYTAPSSVIKANAELVV